MSWLGGTLSKGSLAFSEDGHMDLTTLLCFPVLDSAIQLLADALCIPISTVDANIAVAAIMENTTNMVFLNVISLNGEQVYKVIMHKIAV